MVDDGSITHLEQVINARLPGDMRDGLDVPITEEELHRVMRQGVSNKSPGTGEICQEFCRAYWEHLKSDTMDIHTKMFEEGTIKQEQLKGLSPRVRLKSAVSNGPARL
jgi:hypothetical protein